MSVTLFSVGLLIGWLYTRDSTVTTQEKVKWMVATTITLGWIFTTTAGIFMAGYTVSPMIHALMGAIVGYFFTEDGINFNIGGNND